MFLLLLGKLSILRYVTQIVTRISRNRTANRSTIKDRKEELFDIDMIYGTAYNDWMSQVERTKTSINN
jgi:hypothetical protein